MIAHLISGVVGIGLLAAFLGFMVVWVPAPPLIVIMIIALLLLTYDFVMELRSEMGRAKRCQANAKRRTCGRFASLAR